MYVGKDDEVSGLDYKYIKLSPEEFDKLMCTEFPEIFQDRRKPMSQTCMCWGFSVGPGWYPLLYKICSQLQAIYRLTGIVVIADQVKEKFSGLRFYHHMDSPNLKIDKKEIEIWISVIDDLFNKAEEDSYHICAACGKYMRHKQIQIGGWVHDQCKTCLEKDSPEMKKEIEEIFKYRKEVKAIQNNIEEALCDDNKYTKVIEGIPKLTGKPLDLDDEEE